MTRQLDPGRCTHGADVGFTVPSKRGPVYFWCGRCGSFGADAGGETIWIRPGPAALDQLIDLVANIRRRASR